MTKVHTIEISFPLPVELPRGFEQDLDALIRRVTRAYEHKYPFRVMWPAELGQKMLTNPFMADDEHPMEWDEMTYAISVAERENYDWPCKLCNYCMGNHRAYLFGGPAGECPYEPAEVKVLDHKGFRRRMFTMPRWRPVKRARNARRRAMRFRAIR